MMIPNVGYPDGVFFDEGIAEVGAVFEEQVLIKRFVAALDDGRSFDGVAPVKEYTNIQATALIESMSISEMALATGFYQLGDVKAQFRQQVYGAESGDDCQVEGDLQTAGRYSDLIVYRGREYKIVGHVNRIQFGGVYYWDTVLRQSKA